MRAPEGTTTEPDPAQAARPAPTQFADLPGGGASDERRNGKKPSGLRRLFSKLAADTDELEADELQEAVSASGEATPIRVCGDREQVCLVGTLRSVTFRPHAGVPALEAELWDGTGTVNVIWLGRRQIPGISPGRTIKLRGRITTLRGHRAIYNPIYELRATSSD
ncbi:MAG: OB-fold nucleic acid binding domain-containing protein [Actinocrinis sp.]